MDDRLNHASTTMIDLRPQPHAADAKALHVASPGELMMGNSTKQEESPILIAFSTVKSAIDNRPKSMKLPWSALCRALAVDRTPTSPPLGADPKKYLPAISGAYYPDRALRRCAQVLGVQLVILDFDNCEHIPDPEGKLHPSGRPVMIKRALENPCTLGQACAALTQRGIASYGWSTWSSTSEWPRFRIVLALARPVPPEVWAQVTEWVLEDAGLNPWRECIDLPVLRDTARIHFLPARRSDGPPVERFEVQGQCLMPPPLEELARRIPPSLKLQSWQLQALGKRGVQECPVTGGKRCSWAQRFKDAEGRLIDLNILDAVGLLASLGCYVGPAKAMGAETKHRTSCPWPGEHSHGQDDDCGVLFLAPGRWPTWHCSHSHHSHLNLGDLLEAAGVLR